MNCANSNLLWYFLKGEHNRIPRILVLDNVRHQLTLLQNRDPFTLVLIDGDGMIFDDHLLRKGEIGGKEAAAELWNGIKDHVHVRLPDIPSDCRIVTRIYANMKGLSEVCWKAGLVEKPSLVEDFYRGFTGSKILFDFIDVGPGKDRADEKITGILPPFSYRFRR